MQRNPAPSHPIHPPSQPSTTYRLFGVLYAPVLSPIPAPARQVTLPNRPICYTPTLISPGVQRELLLHHFPSRYRQMSRYGGQPVTFCPTEQMINNSLRGVSESRLNSIGILRQEETIREERCLISVCGIIPIYPSRKNKHVQLTDMSALVGVLVSPMLGYQRPSLYFFQSPIVAFDLSPPQLQRD